MYICNIKALVYINNDMFILKIYVYIYIFTSYLHK